MNPPREAAAYPGDKRNPTMTTEERLARLEKDLARGRRLNRWLLAALGVSLGAWVLAGALGQATIGAEGGPATGNAEVLDPDAYRDWANQQRTDFLREQNMRARDPVRSAADRKAQADLIATKLAADKANAEMRAKMGKGAEGYDAAMSRNRMRLGNQAGRQNLLSAIYDMGAANAGMALVPNTFPPTEPLPLEVHKPGTEPGEKGENPAGKGDKTQKQAEANAAEQDRKSALRLRELKEQESGTSPHTADEPPTRGRGL